MKNSHKIIVFVSILLFSFTAKAEVKKFPIGWANIVPCSKITWDKSSIGVRLPTLRTAPQELRVGVEMQLPAESTVVRAAGECVAASAGVCGIVAYVTGGAGCWPAFTATFSACAKTRLGVAAGHAISSLSLKSDTVCRW